MTQKPVRKTRSYIIGRTPKKIGLRLGHNQFEEPVQGWGQAQCFIRVHVMFGKAGFGGYCNDIATHNGNYTPVEITGWVKAHFLVELFVESSGRE